MLWGSEGVRAPARQRLSARVVAAAIASAAIGGLLTASLAIVAVDRLVASHGDQRLTGATATLAGELDENRSEGEHDGMSEVLSDENHEIASSGIRLAVFDGTRLAAGDPSVPAVAAGACETRGRLGERTRACSRPYGELLLVAAHANDEAALVRLYLLAGLAALFVSGAIGALVSVRLTRWALRPLTELGAAIRRMPARAAAPAQLGPASPCVETEEIRAALANLIERLAASLCQAQRFAADAAHELRTPLTTIAGELELLEEEARDAEQRDAMRRLHRRAIRLSALVERLLVLASPLTEQELRFETVALADVLSELVAELPAAERARVELVVNGEGLTRGEPTLLKSLLSNAVDNALKFSETQPVAVHLSDPGPGQRSVTIDVRDRGPGVPPGERERVFEPLYRADPDAAAGYGLGLALIGHIVRAHGGSAAFVDAGGGACLRVQLPAWAPST